MTSVEQLMLLKFATVQVQYYADRDLMFQHVFLHPQVVDKGNDFLQQHVEFRKRLFEDEAKARYSLSIELRVCTRAAGLATIRGDLERVEQYARNQILDEWDVDWIALCREFKLDDAMFQLERFVLSQAAVKRHEDGRRDAILDEEAASFATLLVSEPFVEFYTSVHSLYMDTVIAREYINTVWLAYTMLKLAQVNLSEEAARFAIVIEESNTFHRGVDCIEALYMEYCRDVAARKLQRVARCYLARTMYVHRRRSVAHHFERRIEAESSEYAEEVRRRRFDAALDILPFVRTRLSVGVAHNIRRRNFAEWIARFCDAYLTRKDISDVWWQERHAQDEARRIAAQRLACTVQRVGRACLSREELCDVLLERREQRMTHLQTQHIAALAIQWMYREWKLRRKKEEDQALAIIMAIRNRAAVKIQSLVRRMLVRQFYTLLLLPRYRLKQCKFLQRVFRGAMVRRKARREALATIMQRFVLAFQARRVKTEMRLAPSACVIQRAVRCRFARRCHEKLRVRRNVKELDRAKNSYAVLIQALYRGYIYRRRCAEADAIARKVRMAILEVDAQNLEDDVWRIGRGFIARSRVYAMQQRRIRAVCLVQACLAATRSESNRLVRQESVIDQLCRDIMHRRVSRVQGALKQRLSAAVVQQKTEQRDALQRIVREFQHLVHRVYDAFCTRRSLGSLHQVRVKAAALLARVANGFQCRRHLVRAYHAFLLDRSEQIARCAAYRIASNYRLHANRRKIAALVIQQSLVRSYWPNLGKKAELNRERAKLYDLHKSNCIRTESFGRHHLVDSETLARQVIWQAFQTLEWKACVAAYHSQLPRAAIPEELDVQLQHARLSLEEAAVYSYMTLKQQMASEYKLAVERSAQTAFANNRKRICAAEEVHRSRLHREQLESRRVVSLHFYACVLSMYRKKIVVLFEAEASDRELLSSMWQREADVGLQKAYVALLSLVAASAPAQVEAAPQSPSPSDAARAPSSTSEEQSSTQGQADASATTAVGIRTMLERRRVEKILGAPLRRFETPVDSDKPSDVSDADLQNIFGDVALRGLQLLSRQSVATSKPSSARSQNKKHTVSTGRAQSVGSSETKPRLLHPIQSELAVLQPQPTLTPALHDSILRRDTQFMIEKAKDEITFSAEGIVNSSALGPGLCDEVLPAVESFVRTKIVTGLVLPHATMTAKGLLHLLRVCRTCKAPLSVIDIRHNPLMDDMVANHLIDLIEVLPSLVEIKVAATTISAGKRLMLFHLLEERANVGSSTGEAKPTTLPPVRFARPLQLPRRNGWSTKYKSYELTPHTGRADEIMEHLVQEHQRQEPDW